MNSDKINIVACLDKGFVMPTGVMVYSACVNTPNVDTDFHFVIDESVTDEDKKSIDDTIGQFQGKHSFYYNVSDHLLNITKFVCKSGLPLITYYRLFLTEILPNDIEKVLYLDGDCIVRHSLQPLCDIDLSDYAVGSVFDMYDGDIEFYNRLRYAPEKGYFNAGVLLINLDYWRRHDVINDFIDYLNTYPERIMLEDQDVLNVVFQDKKLAIPIKYNFQMNFLNKIPKWYYWKYEEELTKAQKDPVIVHFAGFYKPWDKRIRHPHPFDSTFYKYQDQTIWRGQRVERRKLKTRIINNVGTILRKLRLMPPKESLYKEYPPIDTSENI